MTPELRYSVLVRDDHRCIGPRIGMPGPCHYALEIDHVRASGGLGIKSPTVLENLVTLCRDHHRLKTEHGRTWRPLELEYLEIVSKGEQLVGWL